MTVAAASDGRALLRTVSLHRWLGQAAHVEQTTLFGESYVYGCIKSGEEHGFAPLNAKNPRGAGCWGDPGNGVQIGWFLWGEALARKAVVASDPLIISLALAHTEGLAGTAPPPNEGCQGAGVEAE